LFFAALLVCNTQQQNAKERVASHRGGILILQGDHDAEMIGNDPAVAAGVLSYEVKKWWVAEGAFCETGIRRD
jgi:hypothetical protein